MAQELGPEREITFGAAHTTGDGHASAIGCAKSAIQRSNTKHRVGCRDDRLDAGLVCLLSGEWPGPEYHRREY